METEIKEEVKKERNIYVHLRNFGKFTHGKSTRVRRMSVTVPE